MRRMLSALLYCALLYAAPAAAQTSTPVAPTEIQILVLPSTGDVATIAPVAQWTTALSAAQCNLAKLPTGTETSVVNPDFVYFDDPVNAGKDCRVAFPQLAAGSYRAVGVYIAPSCNPTGTQEVKPCPSVRSAVGVPPFSIVDQTLPPAAPMGLRVIDTP